MSPAVATPAIPTVPHIFGKEVVPTTGEFLPVYKPATGEQIATVPMGTAADVDAAVQSAAAAQVAWGAKPVKDRVQVIFKLKALLERDANRLATLISEENGKTYDEGLGELLRGIECCEYAVSLPQVYAGPSLEVSRGVECKLQRIPLGVVASVTPFNFPLMVPLWMAPTAIACGNAFVLKPSEQTPLSAIELAKLFAEAGLPAGIFNVVHGGREVVEALCDHPGIQAIGFVGSTRAAKAVYERSTKNGKRCKALGGAKNHLVVVPDADVEMTVSNVVASSTGCAGQRCMAASVLLAVGEVDHILDRIKAEFERMKAGKDIGALISAQAKERITGYIERASKDGSAKVVVDGRQSIAPDAPSDGYFLGPTMFDRATPDAEVSCDEIFGPTITVIRCATLDEAIALENSNKYGNAAAIYTSSGAVADYFVQRASAGMVGVNVGVPVPREPFPFGGWNDSSFGEGDLTGHGSFTFWTKTRKITTKWNHNPKGNWMS